MNSRVGKKQAGSACFARAICNTAAAGSSAKMGWFEMFSTLLMVLVTAN
jgi:hypothetical protein